MKIFIDSETAHLIYMTVASNRVKPKKSEFLMDVSDDGKIISLVEKQKE